MAEFLQTMNLFRKLTHHRFHQRTRLGIVVRNVSVGRRPTNLATLYSLPRHSSIPSTGKNACFALYEVLRLFVSYLSLRRETIVQFLSSRRGFPAFSILINDSRFSLSLLRTTGLAHVRATLWHTRLPWTYASVWKIRGHARTRGQPVADWNRSILLVVRVSKNYPSH